MLCAIILGAGQKDLISQKLASATEESVLINKTKQYFGVLSDPSVSSEKTSSKISSTIKSLLVGVKGVDSPSFWQNLLTKQSKIEMESEYNGLTDQSAESLITEYINQSLPSIESLKSLEESDRVTQLLKNIPQIKQKMIQLLKLSLVAKFVETASKNEAGVLVFHQLSAAALQAIFNHFSVFRTAFNQEIKEHFESIKNDLTLAEESVYKTHFNELKNLLSLVLNAVFVMKNRIDVLLGSIDKHTSTDANIIKEKVNFVMSMFASTCASAQQPAVYNTLKKRLSLYTKSLTSDSSLVDSRTGDIRKSIVASYFANASNDNVTQTNALRLAKEILLVILNWRYNKFENLDKVGKHYSEHAVNNNIKFEGEGHAQVSALTKAIFLVTGDIESVLNNPNTSDMLLNFNQFYTISESSVAIMTKAKLFLLNSFEDKPIIREYESAKLHLVLRLAVLGNSLSLNIDADPLYAMYELINQIVTEKVDVGQSLLSDVKKSYPFLVIQSLAYRKHKFIVEDGEEGQTLADDERVIQFHNIYKNGINDSNWKAFLNLHKLVRDDEFTSIFFKYLVDSYAAEIEMEDEIEEEQTDDILLQLIQSQKELNVNSAWVYSFEEEEGKAEKMDTNSFDGLGKFIGVGEKREGQDFENDFGKLEQPDDDVDEQDDQQDIDDNHDEKDDLQSPIVNKHNDDDDDFDNLNQKDGDDHKIGDMSPKKDVDEEIIPHDIKIQESPEKEHVDVHEESDNDDEEPKTKQHETPVNGPTIEETLGNKEESLTIKTQPEDNNNDKLKVEEPTMEIQIPPPVQEVIHYEINTPTIEKNEEEEEEEEKPKTKQVETPINGPSVEEILGSPDQSLTIPEHNDNSNLKEETVKEKVDEPTVIHMESEVFTMEAPKEIYHEVIVKEEEEEEEEQPKYKPESSKGGPTIEEILGSPDQPLTIPEHNDNSNLKKETIKVKVDEPTVIHIESEVFTMEAPKKIYHEVIVKEEEEEEEEQPKYKPESSKGGPTIEEILGTPDQPLIINKQQENDQPSLIEKQKVSVDQIPSNDDDNNKPDNENERVNLNDELPSPVDFKTESPKRDPDVTPNKLIGDVVDEHVNQPQEKKEPCNPSDKKHVVELLKGVNDPKTQDLIRDIENAKDLNEYIEELKIEVDPVTGDEIHYHLIHVVPHNSDCFEALMKLKEK